jgi:translation initiation factor IF-1
MAEINEKDLIVAEGVVYEVLPDFTFRVELQNGHKILAKGSGKLKKFRIKIIQGDKVSVEISKYDLSRGRIFKRN